MDNKIEIKDGITIHKIKTNKFKTNLFSIFLTTPLTRENVTKNALLCAVLRRGCMKFKSQELLAKELENMYGASFDCGIEKDGDNHTLKFYIEAVNDDFLPTKEDLSKKCMDLLMNIVFNPFIENGGFKKEYLETEKSTLKQIIEGRIDNKSRYAFERLVEEMYKNEPFGIYKFGYVKDFDSIDEKSLYEYYLELISKCRIDFFASGLNTEIWDENDKIKDLLPRSNSYIRCDIRAIKNPNIKPRVINEEMDVNQGKLLLGVDVVNNNEEEHFALVLSNVILGGGANSKLFQNVREKASLAYTAGSTYYKNRSLVIVRCGIDIANYTKALELINDQIVQIQNGDFTEEDILNAKQLVCASIKGIYDSQDGLISFYFAQEITQKFYSPEDFISSIQKVTKEQIENAAKKLSINTIYFLKGFEE